MRSRLALIDGHSLAYRMYFALERTGMKTSTKVPTWATYGFFKALFDFIKRTQPTGLIIAFDMGRETFRNEIYPQYKAHRESMPDDMRVQMGDIRRGIEQLNIPIVEMREFEADDLIATLAHQAVNDGFDVTILTGDQDTFQVIDPNEHISLLMPAFNGSLSTYTRKEVYEKWGVTPEQVADFKGLKGDTSDNIPGVPGVGDKTASKLLQDYGSLENVYAHIDELKGKLKERLVEHKEQAFLSRQLAQIRFDAPVSLPETGKVFNIENPSAFLTFLNDFEFRSLVKSAESILSPYGEMPTTPSENNGHASIAKTPMTTDAGQGQLFSSPETVLEQTGSASALTTVMPLSRDYVVAPHRVVTDTTDFQAFLAKAEAAQHLCLDIETTGLDSLENHIVGIAFSIFPGLGLQEEKTGNPLQLKTYPETRHVLTLPNSPLDINTIESIYVPLRHTAGQNANPDDIITALKPVLADDSIAKIAHNAKFEWRFFDSIGLAINGLFFDTMLASYVLNPERKHGLKALGFDIAGIQMRDIKSLIGSGKSEITFDHVNPLEAAEYAALDTYTTLVLAQHFLAELDEQPKLKTLLYELELPLALVLGQIEQTGVALDELYLRHLSEQLGVELAEIEADIFKHAGVSFNINSPKQVAELLFEKLGLESKIKTAGKTGLSTNANVLETLVDEHPIIQPILDYRQLFKLKSTYIDALPSLMNPKDRRIHTSFNQAVAATGRLSSSNPNLQNIPIRTAVGRQIRNAFVPGDRKNYRIVTADYSQIELRLLAHFSEDPNLVQAFQDGLDIHKATAALVFDVPLDAVDKTMRYQAKAVNFGVIYGQTAFGLSKALGIFPGEAAAFIEKYFDQYPNVRAFIEETKQQAYDTGVATTIYGRIRDFKDGLASKQKFMREFAERAAFNTPLQGSAADLIKLAMLRLDKALKDEKAESKLIMQVHDEVVLEAHIDEIEWLQETIKWALELEQPLRVPLVVDFALGETWMEADD